MDETMLYIDEKIRERIDKCDIYRALDQSGIGYPHLGEYCMLSIDLTQVENRDILTKRDIMMIFDVSDKKALAIMKLMKQMSMGVQLGKEYYVLKKDLIQFIEENRGNTVILKD